MSVNLVPFFDALKGKTAPITKVVDWVFNNVGRPLESLEPTEPPCFGALKMLEWANSVSGYQGFVTTFVAKTMPDKKQIEAEERGKDDGRLLSLLGRMEMEFYAKSPEGAAAESGIPEGDTGAGADEQDSS